MTTIASLDSHRKHRAARDARARLARELEVLDYTALLALADAIAAAAPRHVDGALDEVAGFVWNAIQARRPGGDHAA